MGLFDFLCSSKKEKELHDVKTKISDFFKINIENIFEYNPVFCNEETTKDGCVIKYYTLELTPKEMGIFSELKVIQMLPDKYNLSFSGKCIGTTKELNDFIRFMVNTYGLDSDGGGALTPQELRELENPGKRRMQRWWMSDGVMIEQDVMDRSILNLVVWGK